MNKMSMFKPIKLDIEEELTIHNLFVNCPECGGGSKEGFGENAYAHDVRVDSCTNCSPGGYVASEKAKKYVGYNSCHDCVLYDGYCGSYRASLLCRKHALAHIKILKSEEV